MNPLEKLREDLAKICDSGAQRRLYQEGSNQRDAGIYEQGIGYEQCAQLIRAHDLTPYASPVEEGEVAKLLERIEFMSNDRVNDEEREEISDLTAACIARQAAELREVKERLEKSWQRMDRARDILTNSNPRRECNWGILDTTDLRALAREKP